MGTAVFCIASSHAIASDVRRVSVDLELEHDLKVVCGERKTRPQPAGLGGAILGETDVLVGVDDGVGAEVPKLVLEVGGWFGGKKCFLE